MISDMDYFCSKCGGSLKRLNTLHVGSSGRSYECQCTKCGEPELITIISTAIDFPDDSPQEGDA